MKRTLLLFALIFCFYFFSFSQVTIKHIKGVKGLSAGTLYSFKGTGFQVGGLYYFSTRQMIEVKWNYNVSNFGYTDYKLSLCNTAYNFNLFNYNDFLYFDGYAGFSFGNNRMQSTVEDSKKKKEFVYFGYIGLKSKCYLTKKIALYLEFQEHYGKSNVAKFYPQMNFGAMFLLNFYNRKNKVNPTKF